MQKLYILIIGILINFVYSLDSRQINNLNYLTTKENLLSNLYPESAYLHIPNNDDSGTLVLSNPRGFILTNLWCWSEEDSSPNCKTSLYLNDSIIEIKPQKPDNSLVFNQPSRKLEYLSYSYFFKKLEINSNLKEIYQNPPLKINSPLDSFTIINDFYLKQYLSKNIDVINSIKMERQIETDRAWAIMEGGYLLLPFSILALIGEFSASTINNRDYSWSNFGLFLLGIEMSYIGIRMTTFNTNPRTYVMTIKLK